VPFISYLKDNIARQELCQPDDLLCFAPFASETLVGADVKLMAEIITKGLDGTSVQEYKQRAMNACLAFAIGWTVAFAQLIGVPPLKWTLGYELRLKMVLWTTWCFRAQVFNTDIRACAAMSIRGAPITQVHKRIQLVLQRVRAVVEGEAPFPPQGYLQSLALALAESVGAASPEEVDKLPILPFASGTVAGIARLTKESEDFLMKNPALVQLRLRLIAEIIPIAWKKNKPKMKLPPFRVAHVRTQLCQWKRDSFGKTVKDLKVIRTAVG